MAATSTQRLHSVATANVQLALWMATANGYRVRVIFATKVPANAASANSVVIG